MPAGAPALLLWVLGPTPPVPNALFTEAEQAASKFALVSQFRTNGMLPGVSHSTPPRPRARPMPGRLAGHLPRLVSPPQVVTAVGIRLVWTHPAVRRRRIATALLHAARDAVWPAGSVDAAPLAFTSLTEEGAALARRCTGSDGGRCLAYSPTPTRSRVDGREAGRA